MTLYEYRCAQCDAVEMNFAMGQAPQSTECPGCGREARRVFSAPRLSIAGTSAYKLLDSTARSAHEPDVVSGLPGKKTPKQRYTHNPLHQKLPRP
ncbi:FmdB family zinc ribbon protein [Arthrobacter sp. VKM Ac-2550]|uniref:FmdB family zinc ribbon protein n=1 Tax=Crystallibacter permensis TaxID=1938888 RepID=UPI0022277A01|nr:FmdB family zinc ribbon protein [Arthrobacter sp. VKM Ac-2550]MCW2131774.1 putative regulatory protein, FmdB family [Arthrobacter sp. VKM Ac-2550]